MCLWLSLKVWLESQKQVSSRESNGSQLSGSYQLILSPLGVSPGSRSIAQSLLPDTLPLCAQEHSLVPGPSPHSRPAHLQTPGDPPGATRLGTGCGGRIPRVCSHAVSCCECAICDSPEHRCSWGSPWESPSLQGRAGLG